MWSPEASDFFYDTPPRIMGSETEFTVQTKWQPQLDKIAALHPHIIYGSLSEAWLSNGSKLYYDVGTSDEEPDSEIAHFDGTLEYATPECRSAHEVAIYEKAGEQLVHSIATEITGGAITYPVYKRTAYETIDDSDGNTLSSGYSTGHHENYFTPIFPGNERTLHALLGYLATRPIWAGAGMVRNLGYSVSQKNAVVSYTDPLQGAYVAMTGKRPIDFKPMNRLEVRSGDGNMSPWAIRTKFAMTSLVLRMLEHNAFPHDALFFDTRDIQSASEALQFNPYQLLENGWSAISHQEYIAQKALAFAQAKGVPAEEVIAAKDVIEVCTQLERSETIIAAADILSDRVDWAAKLLRLQKRFGAITDLRTLSTANLSYVQHDLLWEAIGDSSASSRWYKSKNNTAERSAVEHAITEPPTTRAKQRVDAITRYTDIITHVEWDFIRTDDPVANKHDFTSPYLEKN